MADHIPSSRVSTIGDRRQYVVTCSCGAALGTTDSPNMATALQQEHMATPECVWCQHRAKHHVATGCQNISIDPDPSGYHSCACKGICTRCSHAQHVGQCPFARLVEGNRVECFCGLVTDYD